LIKAFGKDFHKASVSAQREVLRDFIHRIVVGEEGVTLEYNVGPREDLLPGDSPEFNEIFESALSASATCVLPQTEHNQNRDLSLNSLQKKENPTFGSATYRSGVRTLFKLVETPGIEPGSESHPSPASTCVVCVLD
jgi:hypothetical protein